MKKSPTSFPCLKFNQYGDDQHRDLLFMFAAPARTIDAWAGVPRKGWQIRMLYQRQLDSRRVKELRAFWNDASRLSDIGHYAMGPNAITVAVDGMPTVIDGKINLTPAKALPGKEPLENIMHLAPMLLSKVSPRLSQAQRDVLAEALNSPFAGGVDVDGDYVFEFAMQLVQMQSDAARFAERAEYRPWAVGGDR